MLLNRYLQAGVSQASQEKRFPTASTVGPEGEGGRVKMQSYLCNHTFTNKKSVVIVTQDFAVTKLVAASST